MLYLKVTKLLFKNKCLKNDQLMFIVELCASFHNQHHNRIIKTSIVQMKISNVSVPVLRCTFF